MAANYSYTRLLPADLLEVAADQGADTTISAAIAAIQSNGHMTKTCPKCKDQGGNPTGYNTIPISGGTVKVMCTVCQGTLKTVLTYMPDPNSPGNYIALTIAGPATVVTNATIAKTANVQGGTWASSDQNKATVNADTGVVTGVAAGTTNITYTIGNYSTSVTVTVTAN